MQKQMRDPGNETVLYLSVVRSGWNHIPRSEQFFFFYLVHGEAILDNRSPIRSCRQPESLEGSVVAFSVEMV